MRARLRQLRRRDAVLFVVVAGAVAVVGVIAGRAAGLQGGAAVATEQPLTLTLSVSEQICETERALDYLIGESWKDEDGNWHGKFTSYGWGNVSSHRVRWRVSGGQAPYKLVIDHETQDEFNPYRGASGTAFVGCADASVGTAFDWPEEGRLYDSDPKVDSGWKSVNAVVTDANGDTAKASTEFYILRSVGVHEIDHQMRGGETYRVFGHLMTVPEGTTLRIGEYGNTEGPNIQSFVLVGTGARILLNADTYVEVARRVPAAQEADADRRVNLNNALDELADSIGQLPDLGESRAGVSGRRWRPAAGARPGAEQLRGGADRAVERPERDRSARQHGEPSGCASPGPGPAGCAPPAPNRPCVILTGPGRR